MSDVIQWMGKEEMSKKCWLKMFIETDHLDESIYSWDGNTETNTIIWDVTPCILEDVYWRFGETGRHIPEDNIRHKHYRGCLKTHNFTADLNEAGWGMWNEIVLDKMTSFSLVYFRITKEGLDQENICWRLREPVHNLNVIVQAWNLLLLILISWARILMT